MRIPKVNRLFEGEGKTMERRLKEETAYLVAHEGGAVTLVADAFGRQADRYYGVFDRLLEEGLLREAHTVALARTQTGLELRVS